MPNTLLFFIERRPHRHANIPQAFEYDESKEMRENTLHNLTVLHNIYETYCTHIQYIFGC